MIINKHKINNKHIIIIVVVAILMIASIITAIVFYQKNSSKLAKTSANHTSDKSSIQIISSKKSSGDNTPTKIDLSSDVVPSAPSGTFVSNHQPNLSGNPAPNLESSSCTTTPGAQCKITFIKDGQVAELPAKTTDSDGNVNWEWHLADLNLSVGEWSVTATAINGSKTSSSTDSLALIVSQ